MARNFRSRDEYEKEFVRIIDRLSYSRQKWQVWSDLVAAMACAISNSVDRRNDHWERREKEYLACVKNMGDAEAAARAFAVVVDALEANPDQDFLGDMYMSLELGNHWTGQFFTPYSISRMMAEMMLPDPAEKIRQKGWISICDPCIGGGAMLVAAAGKLRRQEVNYHDHALFIGQDIDRIVGMMAYIQLSLLGCPGYIVIADTLRNPVVGDALMPAEQEGQEFWYTPFYFKDTWDARRRIRLMDQVFRRMSKKTAVETTETMGYTFFFDFRGGSELYESEWNREAERLPDGEHNGGAHPGSPCGEVREVAGL